MRLGLQQVIVCTSIAVLTTASHAAVPLAPQCPADAIVDLSKPNPQIKWTSVRSELEGRACLQNLGAHLGPERMRRWFEMNGFKSPLLSQRRPEVTFLTAAWPIHKNGLLFRDGIWKNFVHGFAYAMSVEVYWVRDNSVNVNIGYTYE